MTPSTPAFINKQTIFSIHRGTRWTLSLISRWNQGWWENSHLSSRLQILLITLITDFWAVAGCFWPDIVEWGVINVMYHLSLNMGNFERYFISCNSLINVVCLMTKNSFIYLSLDFESCFSNLQHHLYVCCAVIDSIYWIFRQYSQLKICFYPVDFNWILGCHEYVNPLDARCFILNSVETYFSSHWALGS